MNNARGVERVGLSLLFSSRVGKCGRLQKFLNRFSLGLSGALVAQSLRFAKSTQTGVFADLRRTRRQRCEECTDRQNPAKLGCMSDGWLLDGTIIEPLRL